jgi:hypothetical protein
MLFRELLRLEQIIKKKLKTQKTTGNVGFKANSIIRHEQLIRTNPLVAILLKIPADLPLHCLVVYPFIWVVTSSFQSDYPPILKSSQYHWLFRIAAIRNPKPTSLRYSLLASAPFILLGLLSRPSFVVARWGG